MMILMGKSTIQEFKNNMVEMKTTLSISTNYIKLNEISLKNLSPHISKSTTMMGFLFYQKVGNYECVQVNMMMSVVIGWFINNHTW